MIEEAPQRRLEIRSLRQGDRERLFEMRVDPVQLAYGSPAFVELPASPEAMTEHVERARQAHDKGEPGLLGVVDPADPDRLLGDVAWRYDVPPPLRVADVGYSVHPDSRRRGVATAAVRLMVAWLTTDERGPGLARVQLDHSTENVASCRTALSAGMRQEGVRRGFLPLRDPDAPGGVRRHDVCLHGVVAAGG